MKGEKEGAILTVEDLMARWAYSELTSSRFGKEYGPHISAQIIEEANNGRPFEQVSESERQNLVAAIEEFRGGMCRIISKLGTSRFELHFWDTSQLLSCLTLPIFGKVPFFRFLAMPQLVDSLGQPRKNDPRRESASIPFDPNFRVEGPLIALHHDGREVLFDGYLRSILWLRNSTQPLAIWIPKP
ncbi:MAG: hypothetical protein KUG65_08400 [Sphingomonadaceae bacterium]|nr:hypothetical protein [Sphingomonadaceae bacterium]